MAKIGQDIALAKQLLEQGELVAIPTETVYGLAANALNPDSVSRIFETKNRPAFDPLIIHTDAIEKVGRFVLEFPDPLKLLAEAFWPGPLTLLLPRRPIIPDLVTSGLDQVAVRIPSHPLTKSLLSTLDFPLAAPSANPFGYISPTSAAHVQKQLGEKIPYILDGGKCEVGLESTIVGMEDGEIIIYRLGGLELSAIEARVGQVQVKTHSSSNPSAPGLLESHYAPRKRLILGDLEAMVSAHIHKELDFGVLSFQRKFRDVPHNRQVQLSESGNLREAAQKLFSAMRELDELEVDCILAERLPDEGLGKAINDRLQRASAGN
ncbi:L-threonylcarbamoyladenylate synthase [Algoriphagus hitonicola]|uniref:Threonylcarbamoyl-AMP synthase n=1 Tax=Algoriphagus hitonicola TaxID=435880 RepID=A0A1I2WAH7_9BACT|nr:L-threonylcarbamoyladenylate synthase [Algoriphagus hitonicola]SFG98400.1 L-threonylcarbamoyladenylate synthase [Algoriphagus hitonicola]